MLDFVEGPVPLLSPWENPHSPEALVEELQREIASGHELDGLPVRALAVARDRDDVLFEVGSGHASRYAVVHLTWSRKRETNTRFPQVQLFNSIGEWIEWMKRDHEEYRHGSSREPE